MKTIVVPTDFSTESIQALNFAMQIANKSKGNIWLLHVTQLPVIYDPLLSSSLYVDDSIVKESDAMVQKHFTKVLAKYENQEGRIKTFIEYGNPTSSILNFAKEKKADLVVMGTKGASGLKEYLIGSNTEKIVRSSHVPVISVPKSSKLTAIKNIVFPHSLLDDEDGVAAEVKKLQEFAGASIHIVFVNTPSNFIRDRESMETLNDFAKQNKFKNYQIHIFNDITESEGMLNFVSEIGADMIAMRTHGRHGLAHVFVGSVAEDVMNHVQVPVWTLRVK